MAESYWISNVGGVDIVGAPDMFMRDVYEGEEYVSPDDNDLRDRQYSTLAACGADPTEWDAVSADTAMYDISLVNQKEYEEAVGALWDDSEDELGGPFDFGQRVQRDPFGKPRVQRDPFGKARVQRDPFGKARQFFSKPLPPPKTFDEIISHSDRSYHVEKYYPGPKHDPAYKKWADDRWAKRKKGGGGIFGSVGKGISAIGKGVSKIGGDMVHTLNQVTRLPGEAVKQTLGRIPIIGEPISAAVDLSPQAALGDLTSSVLRGERIDKAFLKTAKNQIKAARAIAPYVQTVMSVVPGVGTGVAAAIAAGTAIAEGRTITDAVMAGVKGALPGGPLAAGAFDTAVAITKGKRLDKAAINAVKNQLPPGAREAVDIVESAARGKDISAAAINSIKKRLPPEARRAVDMAVKVGKGANAKDLILQVARAELTGQAKKAFEVGTAMGAARTIQSQVVSKSVSKKSITRFAKHGSKILAKGPRGLRKASHGLSRKRKAGFMAAIGAASKSGQNAHALAATRNRLGANQRRGFDHGMRTIMEQARKRSPGWGSMVSRGRVMRGNWKPTRSNIPGAVKGRVVKNRRVKSGWFRRVY